MSKAIKAAKRLTETFEAFEAALTSGGTALPEATAAALAKVKTSTLDTATLLVEIGSEEFEQSVGALKAKLKIKE